MKKILTLSILTASSLLAATPDVDAIQKSISVPKTIEEKSQENKTLDQDCCPSLLLTIFVKIQMVSSNVKIVETLLFLMVKQFGYFTLLWGSKYFWDSNPFLK